MICSNCGHQSKGDGLKCKNCGMWNTGNVQTEHAAGTLVKGTILLSDVKPTFKDRIQTGPWDHMWGVDWRTGKSGVVNTSVTLMAGAPGTGKSTLLLQWCNGVCEATGGETCYVAAEEDLEEIQDRALRLELPHINKIRMVPALTGEVDFGQVLLDWTFKGMILDSINGLTGKDLGMAVSLCGVVKEYAVKKHCPSIVISHITKRGDIAGLEALQHKVDTTMSFFPLGEGLEQEAPRELVVEKNRNGQAFQRMLLQMTPKGLVLFEEEQ